MAYPPDDLGNAGLPTPAELEALYAPKPAPTAPPPVVQEAGVTGLRGELAPAPAADLPHPDELMGSLAPAAPDGPVTSTVSPAAAPPQTVKAGVGESFGTSQSGFDQGKYAQVEQATKGVAGRIAKGQAAVQASFDPLKQGLNQAGQAEQQGVVKEIEATQAKMLEQSRLEMDAAKSAAAFAEAEKAAFAKSQAEGALAKADYQQSLAEWSAMSVNPGRLFQSAGKGGQFQMGVAAFVHDFLGAKGIKTSSMDTLNRAIDRDIDAQIQNIGKAGQVTQGFKTLWDMQRAQSQSDAEARLRMRGFALETAKHEAAASLGAMDSKLAGSKLQRAQAEIVKEQVKNTLAVEAQIQDGKNAVAQREVQLEGAKLAASATVQSARYSYEARMAEIGAAERRQAAENAASQYGPAVADTSKSGGGVNKWYFKPEFAKNPEIQKETTDKLAAVASATDALMELQALQLQVDGAPPGGKLWNQLRSELVRRESALRGSIVAARAYDKSGKALTKEEFARQAELVPPEGWFTNSETRKIIADTLSRDVADAQRLVQNRLLDITPGMPQYGTKAAQVQFAPGEAAAADADRNPPPEPPGAEPMRRLGTPDATRVVENFSKIQEEEPELANLWKVYRAARGPLTPEEIGLRGGDPEGPAAFSGAAADAINSDLPDKAFINAGRLMEAARGGDDQALLNLRRLSLTSENAFEGKQYQSPLLKVSPEKLAIEKNAEYMLKLLDEAKR